MQDTLHKIKLYIYLLEPPTSKTREYKRFKTTVGENIIDTIKMRNNFWYPLKKVFSLLLPI
jgi:hypothetical protein